MKGYTQYKETHIPYIGQIPDGWEVKRIKYCLKNSTSGFWGGDAKGNDNDVVCIRIADFDYQHGVVSTEKLTQRNILPTDFNPRELTNRDLLLEKSGGGDITPVGRVVRNTYTGKATCSNFIQRLTVNEKNNVNFIYYVFYTMYQMRINALYYNQTTGIQNLQVANYLNHPIPLPPLSEQEAIARYLDRKTGEIDSAIGSLEAQKADLVRYRGALISKTVTRGLNPNARYKETGIPYIGQIPEGWEVSKLKTLYGLRKGLTITKADLTESGIPVVSYGQIHSKENMGVHIFEKLLRYVPATYLKSYPSALVKQGDIIFADTSEDVEGCGNCLYIDCEYPIFAGYHTIIASAYKNATSKYMGYLFQTKCWRDQIQSAVNGVKVYSISQNILEDSILVVPPLSEQEAIAGYLDEQTGKIDALVASIDMQIADLRRYRSALISEAVTGKIDVRHVEGLC